MDRKKFKQLLIIGNGFDLQCGLETRYTDFFKERYGINQIQLLEKGLFDESRFKHFLIKKILPQRGKKELKFSKKSLQDSKSPMANIFNTYLNKKIDLSKCYSNWDLIFLSLYALSEKADFENNLLWSDVENIVNDVVTLVLERYHMDTTIFDKTSLDKFAKKYNLVGDKKNFFSLILEVCFLDYDRKGYNKDNIAWKMLSSLNQFEIGFADYIKKQIETNSEEYFENAKALLTTLIVRNAVNLRTDSVLIEEVKNQPDINLDVLNFNYSLDETDKDTVTKLLADYVKLSNVTWVNIHGIARWNVPKEMNYFSSKNNFVFKVQNRTIPAPIFGIDGHYILNRDADFMDPRVVFTKSFRLLDNNVSYIQNQTFQKNVDVITFYGHSLNQADYSYFESIFDSYDIFNSNVKLEFYYYQGNDENKGIIKRYEREAMKKVVELLTSYGTTLQGKHGENIVNKLILEQRLSILPNPK